MSFLHTGHYFEIRKFKRTWSAHTGENRLHCSGRTVNIESKVHQSLDYQINLFFSGLMLHRYDHFYFPVLRESFALSNAGLPRLRALSAARCDANSFFCKERITSIIRS